MNNKLIENTYFIIDFDSTFVTVEALEELAAITLNNNPQREKILTEIKQLTEKAMTGKLPFPESLKKRVSLLSANKKTLIELITFLKTKISTSVLRNKEFFRENANNMYIISGGFKDFIVPVVKDFGIDSSHVLANTFTFDTKGTIIGYDNKNPLANTGGKTKALKSLNLPGKKIMIGDGYTDYETKKNNAVDTFYAFIENVNRPQVTDNADDVLFNFDELLYALNIPRSVSYPKSKITALFVGDINEIAKEKFQNEGYTIETIPHSLPQKELLEKISDISILLVDPRTIVSKKILDAAKKLLAIGRFGLGTNNIDLEYAAKKGIAVYNAPFSNIRSVAELVLGTMLSLSRRITDQNNQMHTGIWQKPTTSLHEIRGKKLGIIGYDAVGSQLSVLAELLGMHVYFYDVEDRLPLGNAQKCASLEDVLKLADVISLHIDESKEHEGLFTKREFDLMKQGVLLINLSRGYVINEKLLASYIKSGKVAGAAIDVFTKEPTSTHFSSPLQNLSNVILTPHSGGTTKEAETDSGEYVSHQILKFINAGSTKMCVNLPRISVSENFENHRFIHIYTNTPGILAKINTVFSKHNVQIQEQLVKMNALVGYAVIDVNKTYNEALIKALKTIPGTVKVRVLY